MMGVRHARNELIVDRMRNIESLIESIDLSDAVVEQKQIIQQLKDLKILLLAIDLDLKIGSSAESVGEQSSSDSLGGLRRQPPKPPNSPRKG